MNKVYMSEKCANFRNPNFMNLQLIPNLGEIVSHLPLKYICESVPFVEEH